MWFLGKHCLVLTAQKAHPTWFLSEHWTEKASSKDPMWFLSKHCSMLTAQKALPTWFLSTTDAADAPNITARLLPAIPQSSLLYEYSVF